MRRFIFILICSFLFVCNACASSTKQSAPSAPIVKLDSANIVCDIGGVKKESVSTKIIRIQNKLERALTIREVRSSCACVEAALAAQTLARNGIAELTITLNTVGYNDEAESVIYILTEDMRYELISLKIISHIVE